MALAGPTPYITIEDHALVQPGFLLLLEARSEISLVGETATG
jgi:hypothetical protein